MVTRIITFHGKHSDEVYDASTDEALSRACASVLKERYETGWFYEPDKEDYFRSRPGDGDILKLTDEALAVLPEAIRAEFAEKKARLERREKDQQARYDADLRDWQKIVKLMSAETLDEAADMKWTRRYTLSSGEKKVQVLGLAWAIVRERADYEYEGYDLTEVEEPVW